MSLIIAFYIILSAEISQSGFISTLGKLFSGTGLIQFAKHLFAKPYIPILIVIFYFSGCWARRKMNRVFSEFWHVILHEVKKTREDSGSLDEISSAVD
jgi:hypothetical protein